MAPIRLYLCLLVALPLAASARADDETSAVVERSSEVYRELVESSDRKVPNALLEKCDCVGVFPKVYKAAIGFGGRYGKGVVTCRNADGKWSPVAFFKMTGGSWGLQIGGQSTELVLFFMTERSARSLLDSKFTLGAQAGVAAGPVGRAAEASTDLKLDAEIYSYARSKGLFAGLSLEGARVAAFDADNARFYGAPATAKALLFEHKAPSRPAAMEKLLGLLP
jgi:lipid-binding SYLF domain-containing protein